MRLALTRRRERSERGAVAIIFAVSLTALLVVVGLIVDFGLVRIDRQVNKSGADSATLAGLHALGAGDGTAHPYRGICTALRYLKENDPRFASIDESVGWTDGLNTPAGNGCADTPEGALLRGKTCKASTSAPWENATWAKFNWSGSYQGMPLEVEIQSGYDLANATWAEDDLPASAADEVDTAKGCDQLAVTITQSRKPGFGSLATASDLTTAVRSVGRVQQGPGGNAPAMLLLKQSGCTILTAGSSGGGSKVFVEGAVSADGVTTQPGTIHSDSDGSGCGSNENIYTGQADNGIVAYAAPLTSNPSSPDLAKPGQISAYAAKLGVASGSLRDSSSRVCGSAGVFGTGTCPGADVNARDRVTRWPVDDRYLTGAQNVRNAANAVFSTLAGTPPTTLSGYATVGCNATQATIDALNLTAASKAYVYCASNASFTQPVTIKAGTIVFAGKGVAPSGTLSMPNATKVYINGYNGDAISVGNNSTFSMHSGSNTDPGGLCRDSSTSSTNKAVLVVNNGDVKQTGGTLQMCYTTVVMMGGQYNACMPISPSALAPDPNTPCAGGTGNGQFTQTGGNVDWTAPNRYDVMNLLDGSPDPAKSAEWSDAGGPEDLALWSESGGSSSNPKFQMTGGGTVHLVGVLVTPNAQPFTLTGQFNQTLVNAQYVTSSISLSSNNTKIIMRVDPNAAVTLPELEVVGLVR